MEIDPLLDLELDDHIAVPAKKRKKVIIGLDDLLTDHYKQKSKVLEKSKKAKTRKHYSSDEDEDTGEANITRCVEECQKEIGKIYGDDEVALWGLQIFGDQKPLPSLVSPDLESCTLLTSLNIKELESLLEVDLKEGENFLERLLVDGWLLKLVFANGHVEKSIAMWTFNLMFYSSKEVLQTASCDFWCEILSPRNKAHPPKIDWLPNPFEVKGALELYGFLPDAPFKLPPHVDLGESNCGGPPQNIRAWIKYLSACSQVRTVFSIFSTSDAEELLASTICLFLDRQLLGLSVILHDCLLSTLRFFTVNEWKTSCEKVAKSLARRVPADVNSLRVVESISAADPRSKQLRSAVAFQILLSCFENKFSDADDMLRMLISINVKDTSCDLFKIYIFLVLTENWILYNPVFKDKSVILEMWGVFLRNCSCQISSTDLRPHASKVRSKAAYLIQGYLK